MTTRSRQWHGRGAAGHSHRAWPPRRPVLWATRRGEATVSQCSKPQPGNGLTGYTLEQLRLKLISGHVQNQLQQSEKFEVNDGVEV